MKDDPNVSLKDFQDRLLGIQASLTMEVSSKVDGVIWKNIIIMVPEWYKFVANNIIKEKENVARIIKHCARQHVTYIGILDSL